MTPTKMILMTVFGIKAFTVMFLVLNSYLISDHRMQSVEMFSSGSSQKNSSSYSFDDPYVAYYLLEKLDIFSVVEDGDIPTANYSTTARGFKINPHYCEEHRSYFVTHAEETFSEQKFITDFWMHHKIRSQVIPAIGQDLQPEINPVTGQQVLGQYIFDMRVDGQLFFMTNLFYYRRQVGKQFSCLTQASNHIPGHDNMYRKDHVGKALVSYAKKYESRPDCFNYERYFPKTWMLQDKDQCLDFFAEFNSESYEKLREERNVVYFRKIGADVHEGKGVFPVTKEEEAYIKNLYKYGELCGEVQDNNLIQYNVHNPLLINGRKFGFRSFFLIASTNPVIAYYHDGYLRLSLDEYDASSKDIKTFVTNIGVNLKEATQDTAFQNMTEADIQEHTTWFLEQFQDYMMQAGIVNDPNWLDNYLRPQFKKVMIHLTRLAQSAYLKKSSVYELYGLDFVMDENLGLWFIEANTMPLIDGFTNGSTVLMNTMLTDSYEIIFGLLRSRAKRIINYVNELTEELGQSTRDGEDVPELDAKRAEFEKLTQNYFEPEFKISATNTFQKIIDENETGNKRYAGLLDQTCF